MRQRRLASFRFALLTSLGLIHACGAKTDSATDEDGADLVEDTTLVEDTSGTTNPAEAETSATDPSEPDNATTDEALTSGEAPTGETPTPGQFPAGGEFTHRVSADTCASELPRERVLEAVSEFFGCLSDADCTAQAHGRCEPWSDPGTVAGSGCSYGCINDADCGAGFLCECGSPVGACVQAHDCVTDSDCAVGSLCARYQYFDGCDDIIGYACTSANDQCASNTDCTKDTQCAWTATGRQCLGIGCVIGRPFLIDGEERLAVEAERGDWLAKSTLSFDGLSAEQRRQLACEWERIGLMEHASIAAFARFSLQLLALGAPPELLEAAQDAMSDETRHTQLAFGIASELRGKNMGPGALSMGGSVLEKDLESIVLLSVLEGCIGETVAALEAQELAASAKNAELQALLGAIAQDEQRHAELAYKFVKWALSLNPMLASSVRTLLRSEVAYAEAAAQSVSANISTDKEWMLPYGIYGDARRGRLRAEVLRSVVVPCIDNLLSQET